MMENKKGRQQVQTHKVIQHFTMQLFLSELDHELVPKSENGFKHQT